MSERVGQVAQPTREALDQTYDLLNEAECSHDAHVRFALFYDQATAQAKAAEKLAEALEGSEDLLADLQKLVVMYLEPGDRRIQTEHDFANAIIERLDGPKQRKTQKANRTALAEYREGKP